MTQKEHIAICERALMNAHENVKYWQGRLIDAKAGRGGYSDARRANGKPKRKLAQEATP